MIILFVGVMQVVWFHMRFIALVCQPRLPTVNLVALIGPDPPNLRGVENGAKSPAGPEGGVAA